MKVPRTISPRRTTAIRITRRLREDEDLPAGERMRGGARDIGRRERSENARLRVGEEERLEGVVEEEGKLLK